ncbi:MAG: hypothetical protein ACPG4X_15910 [Pikeienuella sp.]
MTPKQIEAQISQLCNQVDNQEATINRLRNENGTLRRERDYWKREAHRQAARKPTQEEIHNEIFGGQG